MVFFLPFINLQVWINKDTILISYIFLMATLKTKEQLW